MAQLGDVGDDLDLVLQGFLRLLNLQALVDEKLGVVVVVVHHAVARQVWSLTQFYSVDFSQSRIGVKECNKRKKTMFALFLNVPWEF